MSPSRLIQRHPDLDAALKRLAAALDLLEAAVARHERAEDDRRDLNDVLAAVEEDRGRLAEALDNALKARARLAESAEAVADRLRSTGTALRGLIDAREAREAREAPEEAQDEQAPRGPVRESSVQAPPQGEPQEEPMEEGSEP